MIAPRRIDVTIWPETGEVYAHGHGAVDGSDEPVDLSRSVADYEGAMADLDILAEAACRAALGVHECCDCGPARDLALFLAANYPDEWARMGEGDWP